MWRHVKKMWLNVWRIQKKALSLLPTNQITHHMDKVTIKMERVGLTMEADREEVAVALKTWRLRVGKTQQEVADEWQMSRYTILRAERGKPISWMMAYRIFANLARELEKEGKA